MDNTGDIKALFIVVNAGFTDAVMEVARAAGVKGATILHARGEGSMHKSFLGITVDSEKEIILSLIEKNIADDIMAAIADNAGFLSPSHAICFTMPVEKTTKINNFIPLPHDANPE